MHDRAVKEAKVKKTPWAVKLKFKGISFEQRARVPDAGFARARVRLAFGPDMSPTNDISDVHRDRSRRKEVIPNIDHVYTAADDNYALHNCGVKETEVTKASGIVKLEFKRIPLEQGA